MIISPVTLTEAEVRKMTEEMLALQKRVDEEWKAGRRDGVRLGIYGAADALGRLAVALNAGDVDAFVVALSDLGAARMSLAAHCGVWRRSLGGRGGS